MDKNNSLKKALNYLLFLLFISYPCINTQAQTESATVINDTLDAMVDTLAGVQEMEFQRSVEEQARGDIAALRQFIKDSLQLIHDEALIQQKDSLQLIHDEAFIQQKDSLATLFNNQITDILNQNSMEASRLNKTIRDLRDSLLVRKQPKPMAAEADEYPFDPILEDRFFRYEKMLKRQKVKSTEGFLILSTEIEDIHPFQIAELERYINRFFPVARCDSVQDYLTQIYIRKEDWAKAELSIIKFIFLYPESPLYQEVKTIRANIFQTERVYKDFADDLKNIVDTTAAFPDIKTRYYEFVKLLKDFPDPALKAMFFNEAHNYLELYPLAENSAQVCLWLAQRYDKKQRPQSAFITYNRIMIFYPDGPEMITALYQSGRIQEKDFEEYDRAIETYYHFIEQFPQDSLTAFAHNRIAKISDNKQQNWEKAVEEYQVAADLFFDAGKTEKSIDALMRKAVIQSSQMSMIQSAVNSYLLIEERFPGTRGAQRAIMAAGRLYQEQEQFEEAVTQYMSLYEKYPDAENVLDALDNVVDIYDSELGDHDKTVETLNLIITNYPDSKNASKAEKLLKKLQKAK